MIPDATTVADPAQAHERLVCYRHPDRETYVRCGRCERPICSTCTVAGPVGSRCRDCGAPMRDPLTTFTPIQVATGGGLALAAGLVSGVAGGLGLLGLCVALFAGGVAGGAIRNRVGYKRGPELARLVFGALIVGTLAGYVLVRVGLWLPVGLLTPVLGTEMSAFIAETLGWGLLLGAVACFGARSRLR